MFAYEKKLMEHLKDMEERRQANIDRFEKLIETKYKENMDQYVKLRRQLELCQINGNLYQYRDEMFKAAVTVIILLLLFYLRGYSGSRGSNLMLN
jgi:hypothetical protein